MDIEYVLHPEWELSGTKYSGWWCAYVTLEDITEEEYPHETYREGHEVGIDTNHAYNIGMTLDERRKDAEHQIHEVIRAHRCRVGYPSKAEELTNEFLLKYGTDIIPTMLKAASQPIAADELEELLVELKKHFEIHFEDETA